MSVPETERARGILVEFERRFGRKASGVWAAPGRVNLIGEHTDYNDGFVLPIALQHRAYVAVAPRSDDVLRLVSAQQGELTLRFSQVTPGAKLGWAGYVAGVLWALYQHDSSAFSGVDLLLDSDVPAGAGVSSSAAVECASLLAMAELSGLSLPRVQLARLAQRAETEIAGVPCGLMDQTASLCAEVGHALLIDCRSLDLRQVPLLLDSAGLTLVVIDTRAPHQLADGEYAARRRDCEIAARALGVNALRDATLAQVDAASGTLGPVCTRRARHVVTENDRVLQAVRQLDQGALSPLGPVLNASHASLRDDFQVTVPELDVAAEAATQAGALGARMIGGGFGGSVLALAHHTQVESIVAAVRTAFAHHGFTPPHHFVATPSQGARRVV